MKLLKLVPDNTNLDFMRWRNVALVLSIIATIASLALVGIKGLNLGVDFVGGQVVRTTFAQPVNVEELRSRVNRLGIGEASIQEFGGRDHTTVIHACERIRQDMESNPTVHDAVVRLRSRLAK